MAESTLALTIDNLRVEAAAVFGYNRTYASNNALQQGDIDRAVESGTRQFYWPPSVPDPDDPRRTVVHKWTFMQVIAATLTTAADDYTYDLTDSFGHVVGHEMTIDADGELYPHIQIVGENEIRRLRQRDHTTTSVPKYVAIRPKAFTGASTGQRFEAIFWPTPDDAYTVGYSYAPLADKMVTSTYPYPWGGAAHAETLKASVRASAEMVRFRERGVEWQAFMERLVASIKIDRALEPRVLGKNSDTSDAEDNVTKSLEYTRWSRASIEWV